MLKIDNTRGRRAFTKIACALMMCFTMTVMASCEDDPATMNLVGAWEAYDGCTYSFNPDGTGYYTFYDYYYNDWFTWYIDDYYVGNDCLYVMWDGDYNYSNLGIIYWNRNSFQLGDEVFYRSW